MDKMLSKLYIELESLRSRLAATDYKALKYAEGMLSEAEYEPIKLQRQAWRDEINKIQAEIEALKNS